MHLLSHKLLGNQATQETLIKMQAATMCLTAETDEGKQPSAKGL